MSCITASMVVEHQATVLHDSERGLKMKIKKKNKHPGPDDLAIRESGKLILSSGSSVKKTRPVISPETSEPVQRKPYGKKSEKNRNRNKNKNQGRSSNCSVKYCEDDQTVALRASPSMTENFVGNDHSIRPEKSNTNQVLKNGTATVVLQRRNLVGNKDGLLTVIHKTDEKESNNDPEEDDDISCSSPCAKKMRLHPDDYTMAATDHSACILTTPPCSPPVSGDSYPSPLSADAARTRSTGVQIDTDCLGPVDPGTSVLLDGIVWQESLTGLLVLNVTWRGKTYVGAVMDSSKQSWQPARPNETAEILSEGRRLRKCRKQVTTAVTNHTAGGSGGTTGARRKRAGTREIIKELVEEDQILPTLEAPPSSGVSPFTCTADTCEKKYRDATALEYHQRHAHDKRPQRDIVTSSGVTMTPTSTSKSADALFSSNATTLINAATSYSAITSSDILTEPSVLSSSVLPSSGSFNPRSRTIKDGNMGVTVEKRVGEVGEKYTENSERLSKTKIIQPVQLSNDEISGQPAADKSCRAGSVIKFNLGLANKNTVGSVMHSGNQFLNKFHEGDVVHDVENIRKICTVYPAIPAAVAKFEELGCNKIGVCQPLQSTINKEQVELLCTEPFEEFSKLPQQMQSGQELLELQPISANHVQPQQLTSEKLSPWSSLTDTTLISHNNINGITSLRQSENLSQINGAQPVDENITVEYNNSNLALSMVTGLDEIDPVDSLQTTTMNNTAYSDISEPEDETCDTQKISSNDVIKVTDNVISEIPVVDTAALPLSTASNLRIGRCNIYDPTYVFHSPAGATVASEVADMLTLPVEVLPILANFTPPALRSEDITVFSPDLSTPAVQSNPSSMICTAASSVSDVCSSMTSSSSFTDFTWPSEPTRAFSTSSITSVRVNGQNCTVQCARTVGEVTRPVISDEIESAETEPIIPVTLFRNIAKYYQKT